MKVLRDVFAKLNLNGNDALIHLSDRNWKKKARFPSRVYRLLENNIAPNAFFALTINR
ncbi:MAG: hypothetical protein LBU89_04235 [Fibromonadaceae bacterium]|jgi:hypothetical protein|nr:hypothetical protein [Fibromonadaceae bacterium]